MSLADFWESTPREVMQFIGGAAARYRQQYRLCALQAYYAGAIARAGGKLPAFHEIFPDLSEPKDNSPEAHLAAWEAIAEQANIIDAQVRGQHNQ